MVMVNVGPLLSLLLLLANSARWMLSMSGAGPVLSSRRLGLGASAGGSFIVAPPEATSLHRTVSVSENSGCSPRSCAVYSLIGADHLAFHRLSVKLTIVVDFNRSLGVGLVNKRHFGVTSSRELK